MRNRHLAEWRFLLFTMIVTVKDPICRMVYFGGGLAFESAGSAAVAYHRPPPLASPCTGLSLFVSVCKK